MTKDNQNPGKFNSNPGGTGGQVNQVVSKDIWPSPPVTRPPINDVLEDQAVVEAPPPKDLTELGETEGEGNGKKASKRRQAKLMLD